MKRIVINLQPTRSAGLDVSAAVARLTELGARVRDAENNDYSNVNFESDDPPTLWAAIREVLRTVPGLADAAIVVCEGEQGWDDYLLLHHFDPTQPLDECR